MLRSSKALILTSRMFFILRKKNCAWLTIRNLRGRRIHPGSGRRERSRQANETKRNQYHASGCGGDDAGIACLSYKAKTCCSDQPRSLGNIIIRLYIQDILRRPIGKIGIRGYWKTICAMPGRRAIWNGSISSNAFGPRPDVRRPSITGIRHAISS